MAEKQLENQGKGITDHIMPFDNWFMFTCKVAKMWAKVTKYGAKVANMGGKLTKLEGKVTM